MAKKSPPMTAPLGPRIETALAAGRTQQALELANQLFKQDPDRFHLDLLKKVTLARARHLRSEGKARDAITVLQAKVSIGGNDASWHGAVAEEFAVCAAFGPALQSLTNVEDAGARARVFARIADAALEVDSKVRDQLPEDLRNGLNLVLRSFQLHAEGKDDEARETLQGIGLQSPFLEWKLLLRGLMAFQAKDDTRALENWQRLSPERVPARLAAPLRFGIDPAYAAAQAPAAQQALRRSADRLVGDSDLVPDLRLIQAMLARPDKVRDAFRIAADLLPALQQRVPELIERLKACFFWAVVHGEEEQNLGRYCRTFDISPDDPEGERLAALFWDERRDPDFAHEHWHRLAQSMARMPAEWAGGHAPRLRGMVFEHMAEIAEACEPPPGMEMLAKMDDAPPQLKPDAETCLKQSIELAPDRRAPYLTLLDYYERKGKAGASKADKLAQTIVERFPEEASVWESLGDRAANRKAWAKAAGYFSEASQRAPLDARLREKTYESYLYLARGHEDEGKIDAARARYTEALALASPEGRGRILGMWAAAEHGANETARAQELFEQADGDAATRLPARYYWLIRVTRRKLGRTAKTAADRAFAAALAETCPPTALVGALTITASAHPEKYTGQPTHEKKVIALVLANAAHFTEAQSERICELLQSLDALAPMKKFALAGQRRFPQNPFLLVSEAWTYLAGKGRQKQPWRALQPLQRAARLADALPDGSARRRLMALLTPLLDRVKPTGPMSAMMELMSGIDPTDFMEDFDPEDFDDERPQGRRRR